MTYYKVYHEQVIEAESEQEAADKAINTMRTSDEVFVLKVAKLQWSVVSSAFTVKSSTGKKDAADGSELKTQVWDTPYGKLREGSLVVYEGPNGDRLHGRLVKYGRAVTMIRALSANGTPSFHHLPTESVTAFTPSN